MLVDCATRHHEKRYREEHMCIVCHSRARESKGDESRVNRLCHNDIVRVGYCGVYEYELDDGRRTRDDRLNQE